jgi:hypothetical protein
MRKKPMQKDDLVIVCAPGNFANSLLNDACARILRTGDDVSEVVLLTGQHAGRTWLFNTEHIRPASKPTRRELNFLHDLAASPRPNTWVIQNYGLGFAYNALRRGLVINPLGEDSTAHTNLWQPSELGKELLNVHAPR